MIARLAIVCVHTSPLAALGGAKTGGMNVYVREIARELGRRGVLVDIFTRRSSPDQPEIDTRLGDGVRVVHVQAGPSVVLDPGEVYPHLQQFTAGVIAFATRQHGQPYDIVYSNYWLSGWVAHKLHEVWGTPFAHMYHTLGHMKNRIAALPVLMPDVRITVETQVAGWAHRLIAATPAELIQLLWLYRADRRKIAVIPPGVDAAQFQPWAKAEARRCLHLPPDEHLLLFVGRIEPLKAVDTILEAVQRVRADSPEALRSARLAIIGGSVENPEVQKLRALAKALAIDDIVDFLGAKDHSLLPMYYSAATAVLMPSDYESFGMVALEAMASGTPVIASEVGGLQYLVRDGETGYLVPVREPAALASRITALLTDSATRERLGRSAHEVAKTYAWQHIADRLLTVFDDVVSRRKR